MVVLQELFMLSVSQEIYSRKIRRCIGRREWLDVQYPVLNLGLLVNIDLSCFCLPAARESNCEQMSDRGGVRLDR